MKLMKQLFSAVTMMLFLAVLILSFPADVAAAAPGKVANVKITASGTSAKLSWSKTGNASQYEIHQVNSKGVSTKKLSTTTKTTVTLKNLKEGSTYYFRVRGLSKEKTAGAFSNTVTFKVPVTAPGAPKNFKISSTGSKTVTFKWSKLSGVTGYILYEYNSSSKSYKQIKQIGASATSYKLTNVTENVSHKYILKGYKKINGTTKVGKASSSVSVTLSPVASAANSIRKPRYTVRLTSNQTVKKTSGGSLVLKANTAFTVNSKTATTVTGYLANGSKFTILRKFLTYTGLDSSAKNDYSRAVKEYFVNKRKVQSSSTRYLIWVSEYKLKINIFTGSKGKWTLVQSFPCVVGHWSTRTAGPNRKIIKKIANGKHGGPHIYFSKGYGGTNANPTGCAFHNYTDSRRDTAASNGCVRTSIAALNYIYNTCPVGTTVYVY